MCDTDAAEVGTTGDCDDASSAVNPGATEVCDDLDVDEDCDGAIDDADPDVVGQSTWYVDADGDGYGTGAGKTSDLLCDAPSGYGADTTDCDDTDATVNPGIVEDCDGSDDNCDGTEEGAVTVDGIDQLRLDHGSAAIGAAGSGLTRSSCATAPVSGEPGAPCSAT